MRLLTHDKPFLPAAFDEKFACLKELGFDGYEIDGQALVERFDEVKAASLKHQFPIIAACGGYHGWIGDFDAAKRARGLQEMAVILERCAALGILGLVVPASWGMFSRRLPPMIPPRSEAEDRKVLSESLHYLEKVATQTGTHLFIEPLNRYEDYMLNHTEDAARIIREENLKQVLICYDFFHMNIEESRMDLPILAHADLIGHVHLASSHRFQPGSGHLDYQPGLRALHAIGYQGACSLECRVLGEDPLSEYRKSVQFLRKEFTKAGV